MGSDRGTALFEALEGRRGGEFNAKTQGTQRRKKARSRRRPITLLRSRLFASLRLRALALNPGSPAVQRRWKAQCFTARSRRDSGDTWRSPLRWRRRPTPTASGAAFPDHGSRLRFPTPCTLRVGSRFSLSPSPPPAAAPAPPSPSRRATPARRPRAPRRGATSNAPACPTAPSVTSAARGAATGRRCRCPAIAAPASPERSARSTAAGSAADSLDDRQDL